jgi:hypothetical protein
MELRCQAHDACPDRQGAEAGRAQVPYWEAKQPTGTVSPFDMADVTKPGV